MSNVMNVVLSKEVDGQNPGAGHYDLVDPLAVHKDFRSFDLVHHNFSLFLNSLFISTDSHDQISVWEEFLRLFQDLGVTNVIHVEDTVSVDSHRVVWIIAVRL